MALKAKPSQKPTSPAVQEYVKQREAEAAKAAGGSQPAPRPGPRPSGPPPPRPQASVSRPSAASASLGDPVKTTIRIVAVVLVAGIVIGGLVYGGKVLHDRGMGKTAAAQLGASEINQLKTGMTPEQAHAILGEPEKVKTDLTSARERKLDQFEKVSMVELYRVSTVILAYDSNKTLIEVAVGETPDEYYARKEKSTPALWESFPETGFIHQDVWRPNTSQN